MHITSIKSYDNKKYTTFKNNVFNPQKPTLTNKNINIKELGQKIHKYIQTQAYLATASIFIGATTVAMYHEIKKQQKSANNTTPTNNVWSPNTIQETRDPMAD